MKTTKKKQEQDDEMRAEYDFSKAQRGKFYRPLDNGIRLIRVLHGARDLPNQKFES